MLVVGAVLIYPLAVCRHHLTIFLLDSFDFFLVDFIFLDQFFIKLAYPIIIHLLHIGGIIFNLTSSRERLLCFLFVLWFGFVKLT